MKIKNINLSDIPIWIALSQEYDKYIKEIALDITEWYYGSETSMSFNEYMRAKIHKSEAFMVLNENETCCGIAAISKANNRVTFFCNISYL